MCGIAGIMNLKRHDCNVLVYKEILKDMTDLLKHRGPDGEGQMVLDEGHVFLGHRRLAIIDLSTDATQPMESKDGRYCITYNGELYNYKEIRNQLTSLGIKFYTKSDTEVVLNAYMYWGTEALNYFNGMFAFAIWDNKEKELFLARDRYGIKPLYYTVVNNKFVFASEYKAFLAIPEFKKEIDLFAVKEYFTFQNLFSNKTFYRDVNIMNPGNYLLIKYNEKELKEIQYWDYVFEEEDQTLLEEEYKEELDRLFCQAVKRQLVSDVEIGSYLSGGIDSGAITSIASQNTKELKTFTCGFDLHSASGMELAYDEREKAEYMSYLYKTEHYEMVLKAGDMERCMKKLVWHLEDPRVGQSYPNFYAAKLSSNFVKVVLAGTGGDELFAGYPWRYYRTTDCVSFDDYVANYYEYWQRLLKEKEQKIFFVPTYDKIKDYSTEKVFRNVFPRSKREKFSKEQNINYSMYLEAKTFLHGLLVVEDKISMAHGLETRVPFLDNDLVDFAMKIPVNLKLAGLNSKSRINENDIGKIDKYYQINKDGKLILRNMMSKYLPEEITRGRKQGFSAPDASWFKGESIDYVHSIVSNSNSLIYQYIDKKTVIDNFEKHIRGEENKRLFIWSIINFEEWLRLYMCESKNYLKEKTSDRILKEGEIR